MTCLAEYDIVRLISDAPDLGLRAGSKGTVVLTYPKSSPEVVEIEFIDDDGQTILVATVETARLELVRRDRAEN